MKINPKTLFIIDGIGALCSVFFLGFVLVKFKTLVGIPVSSLYVLAGIPCFYAVLDFYFYVNKNNLTGFFLKLIGNLNITYCIFSLSIAFMHIKTLTMLGWMYILVEICIISVLVYFELKISNQLDF